MNFTQQERNWETQQESLPGGPGDKCVNCCEEIDCEDCQFYWKNAGRIFNDR